MAGRLDGVLNFESVHIDVDFPTIESAVSYPLDADIIVIMGFFESDDPVGQLIPVSSLEYGLNACKAIDEFSRPTSDTAKALLSCWEAGGRHLALYRAGDPTDLENLTDNERFLAIYDAYETAYERMAEGFDFVSYLIPADVCFEDKVVVDRDDVYFHEQLAEWCATPIRDVMIQGVMSARSDDPIATMLDPAMAAKIAYQVATAKIDDVWFPEADPYRFISVAAGRALHYSPRTGSSFEYGLGASLAGVSSCQRDDVSAIGRKINNITLKHLPSRSEMDALSLRGLIPFGLTVDARRGRAAEITVMSDNNLGIPLSDFQQNQTVRFVRRISSRLVRVAEPYIGSTGVGIETAVGDFLSSLGELVRSYTWKMGRDLKDRSKLNFIIELRPYFSTKVISVKTSVGPINSR